MARRSNSRLRDTVNASYVALALGTQPTLRILRHRALLPNPILLEARAATNRATLSNCTRPAEQAQTDFCQNSAKLLVKLTVESAAKSCPDSPSATSAETLRAREGASSVRPSRTRRVHSTATSVATVF